MNDHSKALVPSPAREVTVSAPPPENAAPSPPEPPRRRVLLYVLVPLAILIALGSYLHWRTYAAAADVQQQQRDFVPDVRVATAQANDKPVELHLPGQTEAFDVANLFPRATGYVAERLVDIGSVVHKGDLMLRIAAPDLDQELAQGRAQLDQTEASMVQARASVRSAEANTKLADVTKYRETTLASQGWQTKQNADSSVANFSVQTAGVSSAKAGVVVAQANQKAQQAAVDRLQALATFERITAPFDGVVTARNIDVGDLVTSGTSTGAPLLTVERDDPMRIAVYVPQSSAIGIRNGLDAKVTVPEMPGRVFSGKVARSSVALDPTSRSLLTEVDIANPDHALHPGLYVDVMFQIPRQQPGVEVPDEALIFNANGMQVAVVKPDDTVHFQTVQVYRDFGTSAELRDGLKGGEQVVLQAPVQLAEGSKIRVAKPPSPAKPGG